MDDLNKTAGGIVGSIFAAAERYLPSSFRILIPFAAFTLLFVFVALVVVFAVRTFRENEVLIVGVLAVFFVTLVLLAYAWNALKRTVPKSPPTDVDETARTRRKQLRRRIAWGALAIVAVGGVWAIWPSAYSFVLEQRLRFLPPDDLAYLRELERTIEDDEAPEGLLRSLVDELFVVGPADPVFVDDGSATFNGDLTRYRLDQTREQDDIGYQILSRVQVGGLLFRPTSFSITERRRATAGPSRDVWRVIGSRLQNAEQAATWLRRLTEYRRSADFMGDVRKSPMLIMADHEGGVGGALNDLSRLDVSYASELPAAMALSVSRQRANACRAGFLAAHDLRALGLNMNLAPVMDLAAEDFNQVIHDRSFGVDISTASAMSTAYLEGMDVGGVAGVIKHFPGHSRTPAGAHSPGLETSQHDAALLDALLEPFRTAIAAHTREPQFVMSAFFKAPQLGLERAQNIATSSKFMYELLRGREHPDPRMRSGDFNVDRERVSVQGYEIQTLGFDGVLLSDDLLIPSLVFAERRTLTPQALTDRVSEQAIALFDAGHDMLLIGDVRLRRPEAEQTIGVNWDRAELPPYLTLEEFVTVRDRLVDHIFEPGQGPRRDRLRESLLRIIRQKIAMRESELLAPQVTVSADTERALADVHRQLWRDSMGYAFRGGLDFPNNADNAAATVVVTPFGRNAMPRSTRQGRILQRNDLHWTDQSPERVALRHSFVRESPIATELLDRLGPQVSIIPVMTNEQLRGCLRTAPGDEPSAAPELIAGEPVSVIGQSGPSDSEIAERIYEDLSPASAQERRNRKRCFQAEGDAIAQAIMRTNAQTVVFVVVDQRTYYVALFALTALQRAHASSLADGDEDREFTTSVSDTPWFSRTIVIFDWDELLTYSENEFGYANRRLEDGDADVLDRVNLFFPFSGYQERSRFAVDFLMDPLNDQLMRSNERRRMPIRVPGSDIPFSIEDAYAARSCRAVLVDDGVLRDDGR